MRVLHVVLKVLHTERVRKGRKRSLQERDWAGNELNCTVEQ